MIGATNVRCFDPNRQALLQHIDPGALWSGVYDHDPKVEALCPRLPEHLHDQVRPSVNKDHIAVLNLGPCGIRDDLLC